MSKNYRLGIDIGSTTVKLVVSDDNHNIVYNDYTRHFSEIKSTVHKMIQNVQAAIADLNAPVAITGSGGLLLSKALGIDFVQEVIAAKTAAKFFVPNADVAIELGGEDAKILYFTNGMEQRMNGICAGGTGAFIDQMSSLLKTDAAGLNELASKHKAIYPIAARCGVFAKSDIQPLLSEGAAKEDIAASIFQSVVIQTISGLAQGRRIEGNIVFLGGPLHFLPQLRKQFEKTLAPHAKSFSHPENSQLFVALGASMLASEQCIGIGELADAILQSSGIQIEIPRIKPLFKDRNEYNSFIERHNKNTAVKEDIKNCRGELFLGIDAGSTTIKAALIDKQGKLLYSFYSLNEGSPIQWGAKILNELYSLIPKDAYIANACTTGYGEKLLKAAFNINEGEIETIAHYKAAEFFCPDVDFIIDIGGQDMKCMKVKDGFIEDIMLNEACSSGCGSFIQAFSHSLGMDTPRFAQEALFAKQPVDLGTRCTVFMNSRVKQAQKEGATVGDISAGLSYSVIRNALYKVIKLRNINQIGEKVVVQGGTFKNDSVLRCFELLTGKEVIRPEIAEIMGAFGAALIAAERYDGNRCEIINPEQLNDFHLTTRHTHCKQCPNSCRLTISTFANGQRFISGNRCDKGGGVQKTDTTVLPNLYDYKYRRLFDYKPLHPDIAKHGTIGIPRVLNIYENYPLWFTFFTQLDFSVQLSERSSNTLYQKGMDTIPSESVCYPAKLVHGHIASLVESGVKTIFYPCIPYERKETDQSGNHYNCPIVTSYPDVIHNNMDALRSKNILLLRPFLTLENKNAFISQMYKTLKTFGISYYEIRRAATSAFAELARFKSDMQNKGEQTIALLQTHQMKGIVLAGRPYHVDPEINHGVADMINSLGFAVLTEDSIAHLGKLRRPIRVVDQWTYHTRLYLAAEYVSRNENLELVQLTSFGCGLDAVTADQVHEILDSKNKLYSVLKIDELSSLGTARVRMRSLKAAIKTRDNKKFFGNQKKSYQLNRTVFTKQMRQEHTIIFPQMSPIHFALLESAFRANGYNAKLLEKATAEDIETGLKYVNNDACYPSIIVTGQIINAFLSGKYSADNTSVFITQTGGGCRATNYIAFIRKALMDAGFGNVPVISLNVSGLEGNPGFKPTLALIDLSLKALVLGDLLLTLSLRIRPYENVLGTTNRILDSWILKLKNMLENKTVEMKMVINDIIRDFELIDADNWAVKPKVGIVGEILVKFHPDANNDLIGVIEREGGEAVMPGIIDFFLYCFYNANFKGKNLGKSTVAAIASNVVIYLIEKYRKHMIETLKKKPLFASHAPVHISTLANLAKEVLQLGNITGEGWFLTAEMIKLIKSNVPNIVCVQPFACLPNHVTGKGMIKQLRRLYPQSNIVTVDYDPGASEVNQINRLKLMLSVAFENAQKEMERIQYIDFNSRRKDKSTILSP
ncbi:MAG: 2-hydroxyacyl-CoA dehydratase [Clostridiaceae bacterium]|nr:2-hydroxyacyl-CoA dehydratase [Clostridiaceae bacterium]